MAMGGRYLVAALALAVTAGGCREREPTRPGGAPPAGAEIERQLGAVVQAPLDTASAARLSGAFRSAAARALSSVVQIEVVSRGVVELPAGPFHDFITPEQRRERLMQGSGSGFLIDSAGHILTNHHVVENALDIKVRLVDGRELDGELVGSDPNSDVAVIKVAADSALPVSRLGDSDALKVGDWVLALGSPLGLRFSVTAGIVSAMNRSINILPSDTGLEAFIQTDAAINPGNSGGPLVDLLGRVVGVNSAIQTETGYFSGAGFAIPINLARKFADDLIRYGAVHRPRLGVSIAEVTDADAEVYRLPTIGGVEITQVTPGEAADRAGLKMGDVVIAIDGQRVDAVSELQSRVAQFQPGWSIRLGLIRYGKPLQVQVKLGEFKRESRPQQPRPQESGNALGFTVVPLPEQYAARVGRAGRRDIPVVNAVDPFSPARTALLDRGYVILSINGRPATVNEVRRAAARFRSGDLVSLVVANLGQQPAVPLIINYRVP